jgi:hypothetical protein
MSKYRIAVNELEMYYVQKYYPSSQFDMTLGRWEDTNLGHFKSLDEAKTAIARLKEKDEFSAKWNARKEVYIDE